MHMYVFMHACMDGGCMYGCMDVCIYIYIYGFKTLVYRFLWPFCGDYGTFLSSVWSHTWGKLGMCPTKHMWMHARFCYQKAWMVLGVFNQHIVVPTVFGQVLEVKVTWSQGTNWLQSVSKLWDNSYYIAAIYFELPSTDGERKPFRIVYICMAHIHTYIYIYIFPSCAGFPHPKKRFKYFETNEARTTKRRTFLPIECIARSLVVLGNLLVQCDAKTAPKEDSDQVRHL